MDGSFVKVERDRQFDVVVYGATGFTGRLVAKYLAQHGSQSGAVWAIAGRNRRKLEVLRSQLQAEFDLVDIAVIVASSSDDESLNAMAARTRVILSTVGPFARFGEPLVRACVQNKTHYADTTGEPQFVRRLIRQYHEHAVAAGVSVVPCCGFEAVVPDIGAFFTAHEVFRRDTSAVVTHIDGFLEASGSFSGGTVSSALGVIASPRAVLAQLRAPYAATTPTYSRELRAWGLPMSGVDPMVVWRSNVLGGQREGGAAAAAMGHASGFVYHHWIRFNSLLLMLLFGAGAAVAVVLLQLPGIAALVRRLCPPGGGPSEARRARAWFRTTFVATVEGGSGAGPNRRTMVTSVSGGDPGYTETAKMAAEAAVCLALDDLPLCAGVVTPAASMGMALCERLQAAGLRFQVERQLQ